MEQIKDSLERRCPRIGGPVSLQYCKFCEDNNQPCFKVFDCWWEYFDVVAYFKKELTEDQFNMLVNAKPKPKITSLVELIKEVRNGEL